MNKIIFPLRLQMQGEAVADLQDGLRLLLDKDSFQLSDERRQALKDRLAGDRAENTYRQSTSAVVKLFQEQRQLETSGAVDEPTAKALNTTLDELGAFTQAASDQQRLVGGQVLREGGKPLPGALVRAFHIGERGTLRLGEDTTDTEGRYTIRYVMLPSIGTIHLSVVVFDGNGKPLRESDVIRKAKPLEIVDLTVSGADRATFRVEGRVASRVSAGVGGLRVLIVDKTVGDDVQLAEAVTDESGAYQVTFTDANGKVRPDLQARGFAGERFLAASDVRYNASQRETLNVLLGEKAAADLQSEHETLIAALSSHFPGKLGDLEETNGRQDITYLANKTGWDARAVALAALADQFSARTTDTNGDRIAPAFFYALFRAGLPADETALYQTDAKTAE